MIKTDQDILKFRTKLEKECGTDIFTEGSRILLFNMANYNTGNNLDINQLAIEYKLISKRVLDNYNLPFNKSSYVNVKFN